MSDSGERRGGNKKIISILALKGTYKAALCKERLMQLLTTSIKLAENILGVNRIKAVSRHIAVLFLWSNCIRDFIYLFFNCRDHILCGRFSAYILSPPQRTRTAAMMAQTGVAVIHDSIYCFKFNNSEYTTPTARSNKHRRIQSSEGAQATQVQPEFSPEIHISQHAPVTEYCYIVCLHVLLHQLFPNSCYFKGF